MAIFMQRQHHLTSIFLCLSFLLLEFTCQALPTAKDGFSLKLFHRYYSPESPFYNPNISITELRNRQFKSDEARLKYLLSMSPIANNCTERNETNCLQPEVMRPPYYEYEFTYSVALAIGNSRNGRRNFRLHLDTGSGLTWVQCVPCYPSFQTLNPMFDPARSSTYRQLPCNTQFFQPPKYRCVNDVEQQFRYTYADNTYVAGNVALETFTFDSDRGPSIEKRYRHIIFGCAHSVTAVYPYLGPEGIFGMSLDSESFIQRVRDDAEIGGQFSYCFADAGSPRHGFLRFGSDIPELPPQLAHTTPIVRYLDPPHFYYLRLNGVSIGDHYLDQIPPNWFRRQSGTGGVVIDSGSSHSRMRTEAFQKVLEYLRWYFGREHRLVEVNCVARGVDSALCYCLPDDVNAILPSMMWHLDQADFYIESRKLFTVDHGRGIFYLVLKDGGPMTVIGVEWQINYRFVYDLQRSTIKFSWEDCSLAP